MDSGNFAKGKAKVLYSAEEGCAVRLMFLPAVQPIGAFGHPKGVGPLITLVTALAPCFVTTSSYMLVKIKDIFEMWDPNNVGQGRCRRRWAVVVLLTVCSLTVSVATRYTFSRGLNESKAASARSHVSPELTRQRLLKNAATWMPPVVASEVVYECSAYPRIAPSGPPIPSLFYEESLFNRPPPSILL